MDLSYSLSLSVLESLSYMDAYKMAKVNIEFYDIFKQNENRLCFLQLMRMIGDDNVFKYRHNYDYKYILKRLMILGSSSSSQIAIQLGDVNALSVIYQQHNFVYYPTNDINILNWMCNYGDEKDVLKYIDVIIISCLISNLKTIVKRFPTIYVHDIVDMVVQMIHNNTIEDDDKINTLNYLFMNKLINESEVHKCIKTVTSSDMIKLLRINKYI